MACFITFEGIEGCGKTTQLRLLARTLDGRGHDVVVTREPGGCPIADQIRGILLDAENRAMAPVTELLLYAAARAQHMTEVVVPSLAAGRIVLCDRFTDATIAYQGFGRGLDRATIDELNRLATGNAMPGHNRSRGLPCRDRARPRHGPDQQCRGRPGRALRAGIAPVSPEGARWLPHAWRSRRRRGSSSSTAPEASRRRKPPLRQPFFPGWPRVGSRCPTPTSWDRTIAWRCSGAPSAKGKTAHAYLFEGIEGCGKKKTALAFIEAVFCGRDEGCGQLPVLPQNRRSSSTRTCI